MGDIKYQSKGLHIGNRLQSVLIAVAALLVFLGLFAGIRSYEERVAVQAVRLAVEHQLNDVDYALAGHAKDIDALWSVYGPQNDLTEDEFYKMAEPIVESHHTFLPLLISMMGGALVFVLLGMGFSMSGRNKEYHQLIEHKDRELKNTRQKLAQESIRDEESGLFNRKHFDSLLDTECRRAVREFNPLTLMLVEIDAVTTVHPNGDAPVDNAGDSVSHLAELLKASIARPGDVAARFNERGFALLLPATNEQSPQLAKRLCEQSRAINLGDQSLSISIGISTLQPSSQLTPEHILRVTTEALQQAQQQGGDQVCSNAEQTRDVPVTYSS